MKKGLISILIPVYNVAPKLLTHCLRRIKRQTYSNYEIILYDDGSKFNYKELPIVQEMNQSIRYFKNDRNLGISKTLNLAADRANGEYLVRIDADDLVDPAFLEMEVWFLCENPEYIACCCDLKKFGLRQGIIKRPIVFDINTIHDIRSAHGYGYGCSFMWRAEVMKKCRFDPQFPVCEDFDFTLQLLKLGKIKGLPALYSYRQHINSTIKGYTNKQKFELLTRIMEKHGLL